MHPAPKRSKSEMESENEHEPTKPHLYGRIDASDDETYGLIKAIPDRKRVARSTSRHNRDSSSSHKAVLTPQHVVVPPPPPPSTSCQNLMQQASFINPIRSEMGSLMIY